MESMHCSAALPLIPAWADGELSEAQAALLRNHLLSCRECRGSMQGLRALKLWFQPQAASQSGASDALVPAGFSARVARRAFHGEVESAEPRRVLREPALAAGTSTSADAGRGARLERERQRTLQFVLALTSVAALVLIALAIALRSRELPRGERLRAEDRPTMSVQEIVEQLDALDVSDRTTGPGAARPAQPPASEHKSP